MKTLFNNRTNQEPSQSEFPDLGFGTRVSGQARRLMNRNGSFNANDVNRKTAVDLHKIHDYERVDLPQMQPTHS
jgi:hypothetical protein